MKAVVLLQLLNDCVRENWKDLVSRSLNKSLIAAFSDAGSELLSQGIRMSRDLEIQIVAKQLEELYAHGPSFREQSTTLSQIVAKMILQHRIHNHDRLANQSAILRAAYVKNVNDFRESLGIEIACL